MACRGVSRALLSLVLRSKCLYALATVTGTAEHGASAMNSRDAKRWALILLRSLLIFALCFAGTLFLTALVIGSAL